MRPGYNAYYAAQAERLHTIADKGSAYAYMFETMARLADVLALKAEVGVQLTEAYRAGDRETLRALASDTLPEIARRIHAFKDAVETQWFTENKPFGFEVQDIRLGGAEARAQSAARRVLDYVEGRVESLPELEGDPAAVCLRCRRMPRARISTTTPGKPWSPPAPSDGAAAALPPFLLTPFSSRREAA